MVGCRVGRCWFCSLTRPLHTGVEVREPGRANPGLLRRFRGVPRGARGGCQAAQRHPVVVVLLAAVRRVVQAVHPSARDGSGSRRVNEREQATPRPRQRGRGGRAAGGAAEAVAVRSTRIDSAILRHADELDALAIVLGSRGRSGFGSILLGDVAGDVVQLSNRPVFVVPGPRLAERLLCGSRSRYRSTGNRVPRCHTTCVETSQTDDRLWVGALPRSALADGAVESSQRVGYHSCRPLRPTRCTTAGEHLLAAGARRAARSDPHR